VVEVTLHREFAGEVVAEAVGRLQAPAELGVHQHFGQIGDVAHHAGDGQAVLGPLAVVASLFPLGITRDGVAAHGVEGDGLGRKARGRGDADGRAHPLGIAHGPLQHLEAAHGAARQAIEL
jgi:hypothetical protein